MAGFSTYPTAFDAAFPGWPYVDQTEFLDQTQANAWVSAIQNIETAIGYGTVGSPASPLYSADYSTTYASVAARLVATEHRIVNLPAINGSNSVIQSVGVTNQAGNSGLLADAAHVHASTVSSSSYVPIGGGIIFYGPPSQFPSNFFQCNGQLVSTSTYGALYTALGSGTVYGTSGGSFFLPNLNDRHPIGVNATAPAVGATGGSRVISANQLPPHSHPAFVSDPTHGHQTYVHEAGNFFQGIYLAPGSGARLQLVSTTPPNSFEVSWSPGSPIDPGFQNHWEYSSTGISVTTGNTGAGFNYDQPFLGVYYLIRAL
jgi:microcystin-dependent protein